jgi:hypothetical protein
MNHSRRVHVDRATIRLPVVHRISTKIEAEKPQIL